MSLLIRRAANVDHEPQVHDIISAKEKQATPKAAFVFLALLTSKRPATAGQKARKRGLASEYDTISAKEKHRRNEMPMSKIRKAYVIGLVLRCLIFGLCIFLLFQYPDIFDILEGWNFFKEFSLLHLLWGVWVIDMIFQLVPVKDKIPLGSQKLFRQRFRPIQEKINYQALKRYVVTTTKAAYIVMLLWAVLLTVIGVLYYTGIISTTILFTISVAFYVCDLICVLIWCPFRLILHNRCCTTCRIFNWDHLMMLTPMIFIKGFFSISLLILAFAVWLVWEICVLLYPERFWEHSNEALRCSECTDKLCTQYCRKLQR